MKVARLVYDDQIPRIDVERDILGDRGTIELVTCSQADGSPDELAETLRPYDAIEGDYVPLTRELIGRLPNCRVISIAATGWSAVDVEAAADHGMYVCAIGEYCTEEVADHTLALLLALQRRLMILNRSVQQDRQWDWTIVPDLERASELTLGLLGLGKIGRAVAARARAFKLRVIAFDPYVSPQAAAEAGVEWRDYEEVLAESDFISIHMVGDQSNQGLLDYAAFGRMIRQPFIINVSRGSILVEDDLVRALDEGLVRGAGLDVLTSESPDLAGHPLLGRENVIVTPHVAFYSKTSIRLNYQIAIENIINVLEGRLERVNKIVGRPVRTCPETTAPSLGDVAPLFPANNPEKSYAPCQNLPHLFLDRPLGTAPAGRSVHN